MNFRTSTLAILSVILMPIAGLAQSPTHIDQGTNDPSVNVWDDPQYILLIGAIILLGFVFLFVKRRTDTRRKKNDQ